MSTTLLEELEAMAGAFSASDHFTTEPANADIKEVAKRWQVLFEELSSMDLDSIIAEITRFEADPNAVRLSKAQWSLIASRNDGHDKESFEYSLELQKRRKTVKDPEAITQSRPLNPNIRWIFVPTHPLDTPDAIQDRFSWHGEIKFEKDEKTSETFVVLCDAELKLLIIEYLNQAAPHVQPKFIEYSSATKELSSTSRYPTLGLDTSLPQFRSNGYSNEHDEVQQNEWPVLYFFYGSLADPVRLMRLLNLGEGSQLEPAHVRGGILKEWRGTSGDAYKALVDGSEDNIVNGHVFEVQNEAQELALRKYETTRYEVVRCRIRTQNGRKVRGLTFRFVDYGELE